VSHVTKIKLKFESLESLKNSCPALGLQFNENKQDFNWYGRHVGDYPLPEGFGASDMGKCDHSMSVVGKPNAYEIGVCKARDGSDNWELLFDFWQGGHGLQEVIGEGGILLQEEYVTCDTERQLVEAGYIVEREQAVACTAGL